MSATLENHEARIARLEKTAKQQAAFSARLLKKIHGLNKVMVQIDSALAEGIQKPNEFDIEGFRQSVALFESGADQKDAGLNEIDDEPPSSAPGGK
jgi:hypothetical protein